MSFTFPIGTPQERETLRRSDYNPQNRRVWFSHWTDATPYGTKYSLGYHTGADLNMNAPGNWDGDAHSPVYSIGEGVVVYAQLVSKKVWGNLIVIDHGIVEGLPLFSRYGHIENMLIKKGDVVKAGQQIASVGNGAATVGEKGLFPYHLHFDISTTSQLKTYPTFWPGNDSKGVKHHFVDPQKWIFEHLDATAESLPEGASNQPSDNRTTTNNQPSGNTNVSHTTNNVTITPPPRPTWYVIAPQGIDVHKSPSASSEKSGTLPVGSKISISDSGVKNENLIWAQIVSGSFDGNWVKRSKADSSETYISTNPPH